MASGIPRKLKLRSGLIDNRSRDEPISDKSNLPEIIKTPATQAAYPSPDDVKAVAILRAAYRLRVEQLGAKPSIDDLAKVIGVAVSHARRLLKLAYTPQYVYPVQVEQELDNRKPAKATVDLRDHTTKLADLRKSAAAGVSAALLDLLHSPVTEESFKWLNEKTKQFNLRLRLTDDGHGKQPAVRLTDFKNGWATLSTIERQKRELLYDHWPELEAYVVAGRHGNPMISNYAQKGAQARWES